LGFADPLSGRNRRVAELEGHQLRIGPPQRVSQARLPGLFLEDRRPGVDLAFVLLEQRARRAQGIRAGTCRDQEQVVAHGLFACRVQWYSTIDIPLTGFVPVSPSRRPWRW